MVRAIRIIVLTIIITGFLNQAYAQSKLEETEQLLQTIVSNVEVHDSPIEDVLRLLASQNDLNLIIGPDSMGIVSLRFSEVTLKAALEAILTAKGFRYQLYDNIMLVSKPDSLEKLQGVGRITKLYHLKYSDARDVKTTIDTARVMSPWGTATVYYRTVNTEAAKAVGLKPSLEFVSGERLDIVDPYGQTSIPLQARSDVLIITDLRPNLVVIDKLIESLDRPVRQVAIDVHFVETILGNDQNLGVDWTKLMSVEGSYQGKSEWMLGGAATAITGEGGMGIVQFGSLAQSRFQMILETMIQNERAKLLSQPRITTMENQPATITVGITTWIEERSGSATTGDIQITYTERQVPIELIVVPHILHEDRIMLELRPRVEEITGWQEGAGGLQLPLISTRTADSRVEVEDGETAVIGGLIKESIDNVDKSVWLLGSVPIIGHMFRYSTEEINRTDLTIFITPRIIEPGEPHERPHDYEKVKTEYEKRDIPEPVIQDEPDEADREIEKKTEPMKTKEPVEAKPPDLGKVDMKQFFPLEISTHWGYLWSPADGSEWRSGLTVSEIKGQYVIIEEQIPDGPERSDARSGYKWEGRGMLNIFRAVNGGDSTAFDPPRIILPANMVKNQIYQSRYTWHSFNNKGIEAGSGNVVQRQKLLGRSAVVTDLEKFEDCVAVETEWWDPDDQFAKHQRKVIWYAPEVGPVKVEHGIPPGKAELRGNLSAKLTER